MHPRAASGLESDSEGRRGDAELEAGEGCMRHGSVGHSPKRLRIALLREGFGTFAVPYEIFLA